MKIIVERYLEEEIKEMKVNILIFKKSYDVNKLVEIILYLL